MIWGKGALFLPSKGVDAFQYKFLSITYLVDAKYS